MKVMTGLAWQMHVFLHDVNQGPSLVNLAPFPGASTWALCDLKSPSLEPPLALL